MAGKGHQGGHNPFRDQNGEFTDPSGAGKPGRPRGSAGSGAAGGRKGFRSPDPAPYPASLAGERLRKPTYNAKGGPAATAGRKPAAVPPEIAKGPPRNRIDAGYRGGINNARSIEPPIAYTSGMKAKPVGYKGNSGVRQGQRAAAPAKPAPKLPKKWESFTQLSNAITKMDADLKRAEQKLAAAGSRSRFASADAQRAALAAAQAEVTRIQNERRQAVADKNTYQTEMAKYRSS